ncbi:hypothetical protein RCL1_004559 [Eukaryota sp. TZLM3-RCL]
MTVPLKASNAVLVKSTSVSDEATEVKGHDWSSPLSLSSLLGSYSTTGFQASALSQSIHIVNEMLKCRFGEVSPPFDEEEDSEETVPLSDELVDSENKPRCSIFLGYTSNLISSGLRETLAFLCKHRFVDVVVTTAGGIEEDIIKCLGKTYLGSFSLQGKTLRKQGLNRVGNLLIPNDNYCAFQDFFFPVLHQLLDEQNEKNRVWSPSQIIWKLGEVINDESSVCYWCWKNKIPVFCPALTDGSMGDMIYFFSYNRPGLVIDLVQDIKLINDIACKARSTGVIILGGGLVKHHIFNANLMRNGSDYAVVVNTAAEFDGSDAGAKPDEAISWGKIKLNAKAAKVYCDATIAFPLIVSQSFANFVDDSRHKEVFEKLTR